jgi:hypothetical protein
MDRVTSAHNYSSKFFSETKKPTRCQFHQHFTRAFFEPKFFQSQTLSREKLLNGLSYEKCARKMLMKLTQAEESQLP